MQKQRSTRRRWFNFSLRSMLAVITVLCLYLGWAMNKRSKELVYSRVECDTYYQI